MQFGYHKVGSPKVGFPKVGSVKVGSPKVSKLTFHNYPSACSNSNFPNGSQAAIQTAFDAWEAETDGDLVLSLVFEDVAVVVGDGVNTYSLRNLGGGGVLAATYITWNDTNDNDDIDAGEEFLEMDVIHNFKGEPSNVVMMVLRERKLWKIISNHIQFQPS